jgi:hypothetical protein
MDEVDRMALAQRDTHLGVVLEAAIPGTVPRARVNDYITGRRAASTVDAVAEEKRCASSA